MNTSMAGVDYSDLLKFVGFGASFTIAVTLMLMRLWLQSYKRGMRSEYDTKILALEKDIVQAVQDRKDCEARHDKYASRLEASIDKMQDQWLDFQKSAAKTEAVRGRRLDAMFTVLDNLKSEVYTLRPAILARQKELHEQSRDELKSYVRVVVNDQLEVAHGHKRSKG